MAQGIVFSTDIVSTINKNDGALKERDSNIGIINKNKEDNQYNKLKTILINLKKDVSNISKMII